MSFDQHPSAPTVRRLARAASALLAAVLVLGFAGRPAFGQEASAPAAVPADSPQVTALRAELAALKEAVRALEAKLGAVEARPAAPDGGPSATLDDVDQKIRVVDRKLELDREAAAEKAKTAPVVSAGRSGFSIASADGQFALRIRGYAQSDGRFFPGQGAELPAPGTFVLRRVRPTVEGTLFKIVDFRIMPDFGGGTTVLQDAYVDLKLSTAARIRAGKFKAPVGLERLVSGSEMTFTERAFPTALAPNRDVGVLLFGDLAANRVSYALGVTNGVLDGGSGDLDTREGKDAVARLFVHPWRAKGHDRLQNLGFGVAGTWGVERGVLATPALASYRTTGQIVFARYRSDAASLANTTVANGTRYRLSPQGYYYSGRFGALGEYIVSSQEVKRDKTTATLASTAWQLALSYVLTGEDSTYRGVTPRNVFDLSKHTWGAWELTGRYHTLALDKDAFPLFANPTASARSARAFGVGTNWYLNRALKITFDVEETRFDGGAATGDRKPERALLTRFQVAF
jgi:phosphate-selective porin OprO/OprP